LSRSSAGSELGTSTVDLLATLLVVASTAGMALGMAATNVEAARSMGAARYVASVLREARALAVTRSTCVAVRVRTVGAQDEIELFADGNGNGVRTADIQTGIDRSLHRFARPRRSTRDSRVCASEWRRRSLASMAIRRSTRAAIPCVWARVAWCRSVRLAALRLERCMSRAVRGINRRCECWARPGGRVSWNSTADLAGGATVRRGFERLPWCARAGLIMGRWHP
jgi:hypothetical protein